MKKSTGILVAILFLLFVIPNAAFAHTGLKSSNPENNQTVTEVLKEITMAFNTDIEPLSKFEVVDESGTEYKVSDIKINKSQMIGTLEEPLKSGAYLVNWKIIGRDGHPIKGALSFKVEISPSETPSPAPTESAEAASPSSQSPFASSQAPQPQTEPASSESSSLTASSNASWIFLVSAAIVLVAFITIAIFKRKKR